MQVEALNNLLLGQQQQQQKPSVVVKEEEATTSFKPLPPPMVSAEDAAREKAVRSENRAVEHVAELSREQAVKAIFVTPSPAAAAAIRDSKSKRNKKKLNNKRVADSKKGKSAGLPKVDIWGLVLVLTKAKCMRAP